MKLVLLVLLLCSFSNCFGADVKESFKIRVGSSPVISSAGVYLAEARGYFKEQGLQVEITDFNNSGASMTALLSKGELEVGAGNIASSHFNAILAGQKFKFVADKGHIEKGKEYMGLIVREDHLKSGRFKSPIDLKGFKMGLTSLDGVSQQIIAERFLTQNGLKASDVEFVKMSYAEMNVALKSKLIDATIQLEPFITKAELEGIAKMTNSAVEVHPHQQSAAILYSQEFIEKHPMEAKKFMVAYLKAVRDYNQAFLHNFEKAKVVIDLKKVLKIDDDKIWNQMKPVGLSEDGKINQDSLENDIKWYVEKKYVTRTPPMKDIVDNQFVDYANSVLNKNK